MPIILALGRLSQEDSQEFKASLGYIVSSRPAQATVSKINIYTHICTYQHEVRAITWW